VFTGPLSWVNYCSDYTYAGGGMLVATVLSYTIGALLATVVDMTDPVANLRAVLPSWFLIPFLFVVVWSAVANNVINVYSAGLALLALHVQVKRWLSVTFVGVLTAAFAYYAIVVSDFSSAMTEFLLLQLIWLAPWVVMELVDYAGRRGDYEMEALHTWGTGSYWYQNGWNWVPLGIFAVAIAASIPFANHQLLHTRFATDTLGGADLSAFVAMLVAATLYWPYIRRRALERTPTAVTPDEVAPEKVT
jgi:nucleobase:cation symporter-1, NCS1 family